jgi:hypothetical protein
VYLVSVEMVWMELEDMMVTGTIGGSISVCAVVPRGVYRALSVGWVKWTGVRLAEHVALMARTYGKVLA